MTTHLACFSWDGVLANVTLVDIRLGEGLKAKYEASFNFHNQTWGYPFNVLIEVVARPVFQSDCKRLVKDPLALCHLKIQGDIKQLINFAACQKNRCATGPACNLCNILSTFATALKQDRQPPSCAWSWKIMCHLQRRIRDLCRLFVFGQLVN